jgi:hypothetical protein
LKRIFLILFFIICGVCNIWSEGAFDAPSLMGIKVIRALEENASEVMFYIDGMYRRQYGEQEWQEVDFRRRQFYFIREKNNSEEYDWYLFMRHGIKAEIVSVNAFADKNTGFYTFTIPNMDDFKMVASWDVDPVSGAGTYKYITMYVFYEDKWIFFSSFGMPYDLSGE